MYTVSQNKSPLALTDPHDAMPHAHRAVHSNRRPSPVYHTDRPSKLTAPETINVKLQNSRVWVKVLEERSTLIFGDT